MKLATIFVLIATPAAADSVKAWGAPSNQSKLEMHAPTAPDAVATLTFENREVHAGKDEFTLTFDGLTVFVEFGFNVDSLGSERVTVYAPDGYVAVPPSITVQENDTGEIHIVEWVGS